MYDVFISFKNTDSSGNKTKDSIIAKKLYSYLTGKGLKVFFSEAELEFLGKASYSEVMDDALDSSKFLIAVGCSRENLESKWVRYEWDSFLNDIRSNIKPDGEVFVLYQDMKVKDLPRALRGQQAFDAIDNLSYEKLFNFINNSMREDASKNEINAENNRLKKELINIFKEEVLLPALDSDIEQGIKDDIRNTMDRIESKKSIQEIIFFYEDALKSIHGQFIRDKLNEKNLQSFEDIEPKIRDFIRRIN